VEDVSWDQDPWLYILLSISLNIFVPLGYILVLKYDVPASAVDTRAQTRYQYARRLSWYGLNVWANGQARVSVVIDEGTDGYKKYEYGTKWYKLVWIL
jgi:putative exporter of polyketide antibiotics